MTFCHVVMCHTDPKAVLQLVRRIRELSPEAEVLVRYDRPVLLQPGEVEAAGGARLLQPAEVRADVTVPHRYQVAWADSVPAQVVLPTMPVG